MLTLFWTDALFFLLLSTVAALVLGLRRREHFRRPWRTVSRSTSAMVSLVLMGVYLIIGVADSVHFYPSAASAAEGPSMNEPISLLDAWLSGLRSRTEKTYSEPFAVHAYAKEHLTAPDGGQRWDYPRLLHGGAHLADPATERVRDIASTGLRGAGEGLLAWCALGATVLALLGRARRQAPGAVLRQVAAGATQLPWRAMLLTLLLVCCGIGALAEWSAKYHVFGTDKVGADVLYQTVKSIRTGLLIGTLTTFVTLPLALVLGLAAGYFRGWADDLIQYLYTTLNSIPHVLLIAAAILLTQVYMAKHEAAFASLALRADLRLLFLCLILGLTSWTGLCRLLRAETLKLRELEYVQAARALGVRDRGVLLRHILPNVFHIVLISVVLDFSGLVLAEAVLSYINIGVDPTTESWGNMINSARLELAREPAVWWSLAAAFVFMFTLVLAANLFADAVRDALDPRRAD
ncbi:MAG: ABC transporter permease [Gammaproteobacteria bacterium]|nr:ABC transporter permease [Gammaproteobacteria bacterium]